MHKNQTTNVPPIPPRRRKRKNHGTLDPQSTDLSLVSESLKPNRKRPPPPPPLPPRPRTNQKQTPLSSHDLKNCASDEETFNTSKDNHETTSRSFFNRSFIDMAKVQNRYPPLYFTVDDFENVINDSFNNNHVDKNDCPTENTPVEESGDSTKTDLDSIDSAAIREHESTTSFMGDSLDEGDVQFRIITTNVPFEKCLGRWNTSFDIHDDDTHDFIFDRYLDRSDKLKISTVADEEIPVVRTSKVRFLIDSPKKDETKLGSCRNQIFDSNVDMKRDKEKGEIEDGALNQCKIYGFNFASPVLKNHLNDHSVNLIEIQGGDACKAKLVNIDSTESNEPEEETDKLSFLHSREGIDVPTGVPVSVRRNSFLETMLSDEQVDSISFVEETTTIPKPLPRNFQNINAQSAGEVKSNVLNELLSNFHNIKLKPVSGLDMDDDSLDKNNEDDNCVVLKKIEEKLSDCCDKKHYKHIEIFNTSDDKTDNAIVELEKNLNTDKCAIDRKTVINNIITTRCNNVNDNNRAVTTPIVVSNNDQSSQENASIISLGSVKSFVEYYEIQQKETNKFNSKIVIGSSEKITPNERPVPTKREKITSFQQSVGSNDESCIDNVVKTKKKIPVRPIIIIEDPESQKKRLDSDDTDDPIPPLDSVTQTNDDISGTDSFVTNPDVHLVFYCTV